MYLLPLVLFLVLAGYFALALRPGYDPQTLPSAMIDKEAPAFDLAGLNGEGLAADGAEGRPGADQLLRLVVRAVPRRATGADAPGQSRARAALRHRLQGPAGGRATSCWRSSAIRTAASASIPMAASGLDFGVYGVPETYVLDSTGHIRKRFVGPLTAEEVDKELLPLLKALKKS